jgi:two-component system response regulator AtoC
MNRTPDYAFEEGGAHMKSSGDCKTILIGEDELEVRNYLATALQCQGYTVIIAQDGEEVITCFRAALPRIAAVLLDIAMPRKDGMAALRELRRLDEDVPVIIISGATSPLNVVEAMRNGATDFLAKPVGHDDLLKVLDTALGMRPKKMSGPPEVAPVRSKADVFFGSGTRMKQIQTMIDRISWSEAPVLIQGETGVGKEVLARQLHARSPRAGKPILKLNCAALPSELVESELFGYERGAFTGAFQKKPGMFELADGGTILLDEIGDMEFKLQAKLLQVLQDHEFQRLGGKETIRVDVRVIAATHSDLEKAIVVGAFREDLYYRLNVINICLPALRERKEDIPVLADFLLQKHAADKPVPPISDALMQALLGHDWPGNIRELENAMRKLIVLGNPDMLAHEIQFKTAKKLLASQPAPPAPQPVPATINTPILEQVTKAKQQAETEAILAALNSSRWNRKQAAALLKSDYKALLYKMKKLGIEDKMVMLPEEPAAPAKVAGAGR